MLADGGAPSSVGASGSSNTDPTSSVEGPLPVASFTSAVTDESHLVSVVTGDTTSVEVVAVPPEELVEARLPSAREERVMPLMRRSFFVTLTGDVTSHLHTNSYSQHLIVITNLIKLLGNISHNHTSVIKY